MFNIADSQIHVFRRKLTKLPVFATDSASSVSDNLFREFFSSSFSQTLASIKSEKKIDFATDLEKNLNKFNPKNQQGYLRTLAVFLKNGKHSEECVASATECAESVFTRVNFDADLNQKMDPESSPESVGFLPTAPGNTDTKQDEHGATQLVRTVLSPETETWKAILETQSVAFRQVWPILQLAKKRQLVDDLLEKIYGMSLGLSDARILELQRDLVNMIDMCKVHVEAEIIEKSDRFVHWLRHAPLFPETPIRLGGRGVLLDERSMSLIPAIAMEVLVGKKCV